VSIVALTGIIQQVEWFVGVFWYSVMCGFDICQI